MPTSNFQPIRLLDPDCCYKFTQIQISWLFQKPTDLDLHCLQRQGISGFSTTKVNVLISNMKNIHTNKLWQSLINIPEFHYQTVSTFCWTEHNELSLSYQPQLHTVHFCQYKNTEEKNINLKAYKSISLGSVVQSIISLTSSLITNSFTVVAKVFSNTLIFLLQKCE